MQQLLHVHSVAAFRRSSLMLFVVALPDNPCYLCVSAPCREDALMREAELHRSMKEQYAAATAAEMEAWRAIQAERAQAKVRDPVAVTLLPTSCNKGWH